jgi:UTP--glucose-1-phosphate uridylyltransferase
MNYFSRPVVLAVSRDRFLPVKSISDLFIVQSDLFTMKHGVLTMHPDRHLFTTSSTIGMGYAPMPTINFGRSFNTLEEYWHRFSGSGASGTRSEQEAAAGVSQLPSILGLESLTVTGHVCFGSDVALKGAVTVVADEGGRIDIPDGSTLEDQVVTGNFRVFDT